MIDLHEPVIWTDGGPWAEHDHACSVCQINKSVIDVATGRFHPCWGCQRLGWVLRRRRHLSRTRRQSLQQLLTALTKSTENQP